MENEFYALKNYKKINFLPKNMNGSSEMKSVNKTKNSIIEFSKNDVKLSKIFGFFNKICFIISLRIN